MEQIKYQQKFHKFPSRWHLYKFLGELSPKFDFIHSAKLAPFCFADSDGNFHRCPTFTHFLNTINASFNGNFCIKSSRLIGQMIMLVETDEVKIIEGVTSKVVEGAFNKPVEEKEEFIESPKEEKPVIDKPTDVDWDMINNLKDNKYGKIELDEYAENNFGIKLNRRNTLENMIKDLKEQLGE